MNYASRTLQITEGRGSSQKNSNSSQMTPTVTVVTGLVPSENVPSSQI